ncbi:MAG: two-component sensor histidine kinase [Acidimicrobiia bacterium]|nr:two-component sensor histidine kinase [Acidimicrobiia bacterium]
MVRVRGAARPDRHETALALWRDAWLDVLLPIPIIAVGMVGTSHISAESSERPVDALTFIVVGMAGGSLLARRRWPLVMLLVVAAALAVYTAREYPGGPVYLTGPVALYSFAAANERRVAYVAAGAMTAMLMAVRLVTRPSLGGDDLLLLAWAAAAVLAADAMRGRRERAAAALERRRYMDEHREGETKRRLAEDRLQIARDLHDSVAHSMATINVQAGAASRVIGRDPQQATEALEAIRIASRDVLNELAAMLDLLREGDAALRQPTPDLGQLGALVASSRRAGLDVAVTAEGDLGEISPAISTTAYRIVQEALTNVIRHSGTDRATVTVSRQQGQGLDVEVADLGAGLASPANEGSGMGLVGIRERAAVTGGSCEVGPRPEGGFRVRVTWPQR